MSSAVMNGNVNAGTKQQNDELIYLDPVEILVDEDIDIRQFCGFGDTDEEIASIQELADSMAAVGQVEPVRVRLDSEGRAHLIMGHRRRKAAMLIQMSQAEGEVPFKLSAVVTPGDVDVKLALQQAAHENIKRKSLSPMQLAALCAQVREEMGWKGKAGTKHVARFLGVSDATVTQHEKLRALSSEIQAMVHEGKMSVDAALGLLNVEVEKRMEVIDAAIVEQRKELEAKKQEEDAAAAEAAFAAEKAGGGEKSAPKSAPKSTKIKRDTGKIQKAAIVKAARDKGAVVEGAVVEKRSRKEIVEWWELVRDSPAYGYVDGAVRQFASYFVGKWCEGEGTDRTLAKYFDEMTAGAAAGSAPSDKAAVVNAVVKHAKAAKKTAKKAARKK